MRWEGVSDCLALDFLGSSRFVKDGAGVVWGVLDAVVYENGGVAVSCCCRVLFVDCVVVWCWYVLFAHMCL